MPKRRSIVPFSVPADLQVGGRQSQNGNCWLVSKVRCSSAPPPACVGGQAGGAEVVGGSESLRH